MTVEYDGTDFFGWQIQSDKRTTQKVLQDTIAKYTRQDIKLLGAGRTDAGVHAIGQVCSFFTDKPFDPAELRYRLNKMLPGDIAVLKLNRAPSSFNPQRNAINRTYRYHIAESPGALNRHFRYQSDRRLDIELLSKAADLFAGYHDFSAFCKQKSLKEDNHCQVHISRWFRYGGALIYEVKANRFLHHMIRRLVGVMLAVENSKISLTRVKAFLNNIENVRFSVPAKGLVLTTVKYGREKG